MGFYRGSPTTRSVLEDLACTLTPREYVSVLSGAIETLGRLPLNRCRIFQRVALYLAAGRFHQAIKALWGLVRRQPEDATAHRLLGMALLGAGQIKTGLFHLETARGLLMSSNTDASLSGTLRTQLGVALLRLVLVSAYASMSDKGAVKRLALEALSL